MALWNVRIFLVCLKTKTQETRATGDASGVPVRSIISLTALNQGSGKADHPYPPPAF